MKKIIASVMACVIAMAACVTTAFADAETTAATEAPAADAAETTAATEEVAADAAETTAAADAETTTPSTGSAPVALALIPVAIAAAIVVKKNK